MAIVITFDKLKLPPIADPKEMPFRIREGLLNVAVNFNAALQLSDLIPVDQGTLAANINASVSATAKEAIVGTSLIYGAVMEGGRKPGTFPPIEPLEKWVRRKIKPKPKKKKKKKKAKGKRAKLTDEQKAEKKKKAKELKAKAKANAARSVAFAIARTIEREGIPVPLKHDGKGGMFQKTFDENKDAKFQLWFGEGFSGV